MGKTETPGEAPAMTDEEIDAVWERLAVAYCRAVTIFVLDPAPPPDSRRFAAMKAELAAVLRERPVTWQPIETAPKDLQNVLLRYPDSCFGHHFITEGWWATSEWQTADGCHWIPEPTHWMPLPKPPGAP